MSFILDALRKSEIERQRQNGPSIAEFPGARTDRRPPWTLIAIGALLALNAGALLWYLLRDTTTAPTTAAAPPAAVATNAAPPANTASSTGTASTTGAASSAGVAPAPSPVQQLPPVTTAAPLPAVTAAQSPPQPAANPATPTPEPTLAPLAPQPAVTYENAAPTTDALTTQAAEGLPELSMDLHIFSADRSKRAIFVNGRRYTEGATLTEGPLVEEITREGAVLNYRGRRFLLPRL